MKSLFYHLTSVLLLFVITSCSKDDFQLNVADITGFWESESGEFFEFCEDGTFYSYQLNDIGLWTPDDAICKYQINDNEITCNWNYGGVDKDTETYVVKSCNGDKLVWNVKDYGKHSDILTRTRNGQVPLMGVFHPKHRVESQTGNYLLSDDSTVYKTLYHWTGDLLERIDCYQDDVLKEEYFYSYDTFDRISAILHTVNAETGEVAYNEKFDYVYDGRILSEIIDNVNVDNSGNPTDSTSYVNYKLTVKDGLIVSYEYRNSNQLTFPVTIGWQNGTPVVEKYNYSDVEYEVRYEYGNAANPLFGDFRYIDFSISCSPVTIDKSSVFVNGILLREVEYDNEVDSNGRLITEVRISKENSTVPASVTVYRTTFTYLTSDGHSSYLK